MHCGVDTALELRKMRVGFADDCVAVTPGTAGVSGARDAIGLAGQDNRFFLGALAFFVTGASAGILVPVLDALHTDRFSSTDHTWKACGASPGWISSAQVFMKAIKSHLVSACGTWAAVDARLFGLPACSPDEQLGNTRR